MCLINNFRPHLIILIIKTINLPTTRNSIQITTKASTIMLSHMNTILLNTKIKTITKDNIITQKTSTKIITINKIINSIINHLMVKLIRKMKTTLSFLDKNNKNKV